MSNNALLAIVFTCFCITAVGMGFAAAIGGAFEKPDQCECTPTPDTERNEHE